MIKHCLETIMAKTNNPYNRRTVYLEFSLTRSTTFGGENYSDLTKLK